MEKYVIKEKFHFHYAHRNDLLVGTKCERLHGHCAYVKVYVEGSIQSNGVSIQFETIAEACKDLKNRLDHRTLVWYDDIELYDIFTSNLILHQSAFYTDFATSAENMAKFIFDEVSKSLPVVRVDFQETNSSTVIYKKEL